MTLTTQELKWLEKQRFLQQCVFIGIDHHTTQFTLAMTSGDKLLENPSVDCIPNHRYDQDGLGYHQFLNDLFKQFPTRQKTDFYFLSEPSYSQPLRHYLIQDGFSSEQILWLKTNKVTQYRKTHDLSSSGKNDDQDARTMLLMLFEGISNQNSRVKLFPSRTPESLYKTLGELAQEYERLTEQSVQLQNKLFQLVLFLFPEMKHVYYKKVKYRKPDGSESINYRLDLFTSAIPLTILKHYPSPQLIHEAGYTELWKKVGKSGVRKSKIIHLVELAGQSGGVPDELVSQRLILLIKEYHDVVRRLKNYRKMMIKMIKRDPVLHSFLKIHKLSEVAIATLVGAIENPKRFPTVENLKSYLNLAPTPLPQTGLVDEKGQLIQHWRMPTNSYHKRNGQRVLSYEYPGKKRPRQVLWLWFNLLVQGYHQAQSDPFVRIYGNYKAKHQGKSRWFGKVRWKVINKLLKSLYTCLKTQQPYDPKKVVIA